MISYERGTPVQCPACPLLTRTGRPEPPHSFFFFFFFCTLVTGSRRSLSRKLRDTRVNEPQIRPRLGTTAYVCEVVVLERGNRMCVVRAVHMRHKVVGVWWWCGREFFIDNLLVRIHFIIEMVWWTGLAPWEFEFPFPGSHISTFLGWCG